LNISTVNVQRRQTLLSDAFSSENNISGSLGTDACSSKSEGRGSEVDVSAWSSSEDYFPTERRERVEGGSSVFSEDQQGSVKTKPIEIDKCTFTQ
jgi:hypothetical protein